MSELKVKVVKISKVDAHPMADRLDLLQFEDLGWLCVGQRGVYTVGMNVVYFPIDSILPEALEAKIFGEDSKIKLDKHRIRTIKLRGAVSQGMACPLDVLGLEGTKLGTDVTAQLGVTKYEPPVKGSPQPQGTKATKKQTNPNFSKYTDIQNYKNYPNVFETGELVSISEKVHGCGNFNQIINLYDGTKKKLGRIVRDRLDVTLLGKDTNGNIVPTKILNWYENGFKNKWIKLKVKNKNRQYKTLTFTPTHEFYSYDDDIFKELQEFKVGDNIALLTKLQEHKNIIPSEILDIEYITKNEQSYDLQTETHNFFANGVLIHNSNFRAGWVERYPKNIIERIGMKFGILKKVQWCMGSHNVQLQGKPLNKTYYGKNIYAEMVHKYKLKETIPKGYTVYGEVYGGVQKGYHYECKPDERKLVCFDVKQGNIYLGVKECAEFLAKYNLPQVPILYEGKFDIDKAKELTKGNSVLAPSQKVREGVVIKPLKERISITGRTVLKLISDDYLLRKGEQTEFH